MPFDTKKCMSSVLHIIIRAFITILLIEKFFISQMLYNECSIFFLIFHPHRVVCMYASSFLESSGDDSSDDDASWRSPFYTQGLSAIAIIVNGLTYKKVSDLHNRWLADLRKRWLLTRIQGVPQEKQMEPAVTQGYTATPHRTWVRNNMVFSRCWLKTESAVYSAAECNHE